jgi:hypothetical protein
MMASRFLSEFFAVSAGSIFICSLPNERGTNSESKLAGRGDFSRIDEFVRKHDRTNYGVFFCVNTLQPRQACRSKQTISEIVALHADIDLDKVDAIAEEIERKLGQLLLLPSFVVSSGHGFHCYWVLHEAAEATPKTIAEVERLLHMLADHVGGDPAVCEISRLMRLPGSHNTKGGEWVEVRILNSRPNRYDLSELADWLDDVGPFIQRKNRVTNTNPFLDAPIPDCGGAPVDVEARLANMQYRGSGDASIHQTQLAVTAALLNRGHNVDEVVATVLAATRNSAGEEGARWNWDREERDLRHMCRTWRKKKSNGSQPPPPGAAAQGGPLPELFIDPGNLVATAKRLAELVAQHRRFLFNGNEPIQIVVEGVPRAVPVTPEMVRVFADEICVPVKVVRKTKVRTTLNRDIANLYLDGLAGQWRLKPFVGITTAPILEDDGSFRTVSGYDETTGLWCHDIPDIDVPEQPTGMQAKTSLDALRYFFRTFAFADAKTMRDAALSVDVVDPRQPIGLDESCFLVALMTALCRASLLLAPGILATAPAFSGAGTGKGLALKAMCIIASGAPPSAFTAGHDAEELDKRLTAALIDARPAIFLDNYNGKNLTSDILASVLTENPCEVRPMGHTAMVKLHTRTFVAMTGNAVAIAEDMVRRVVPIRFDAKSRTRNCDRFGPASWIPYTKRARRCSATHSQSGVGAGRTRACSPRASRSGVTSCGRSGAAIH